MKKLLTVLVLFSFLVTFGCAGMAPTHNRNMATNAVIWGGAGAAAGALLGGAHGAKVGAVVGSVLGAANTPYPGGAAIGPAPYPSAYGNCAIFPTIEEQAECKRGQNWSERVIREHRKRDAFDYGQNLPYRNYYSRYPRW